MAVHIAIGYAGEKPLTWMVGLQARDSPDCSLFGSSNESKG